MASKTQDQRLAYEAEIRAGAARYSVHLFLGAGRFERAEAEGKEEILEIGRAMTAAYPECQARPLYYAVDSTGRSTTITPAQLSEENETMIKSAEIAAPAAAPVAASTTAAAMDRKAKNAARMRESRAAKKAAATPAPDKITLGLKAIDESEKREAAEREAAEAKELNTLFAEAKKPINGLCMSKPQALAEARQTYGAEAQPGSDFTLKKTVRGEWFWGPFEAPDASEVAMKAKLTKNAPKAAKTPAAAKPAGMKRSEALANAERGKIPAPPDFTAPTHTRFRAKLAEVVALVKAGDIAGLKAYEIKLVSSSPKAIDKYRNLAIVALKAKAAAK